MTRNETGGLPRIKPAVTAIIQARMGSTRLPGKAMKELAGKPMLYHIIERTRAIEGISTVVLATSIEKENRPLIELAESMGVGVYEGSPDNVLERYFFASIEFGGEYIVRVTGDNPFIDPDYGTMAVDIALESGADLCSIPNLPLGVAVEVIKREALDEAYKMSEKAYHFEHVTPILKEHSELFRRESHPVIFNCPFDNLRLTVDTEKDYQLAKSIYDELYGDRIFSLGDVIRFLEKKPELVSINDTVQQRSMFHSSNAG